LVEFAADFYVLRPSDPAAGNRALLMEVVNRGRRGLLDRFNRAPMDRLEPGDGFLFRHGFTLGSVGWQWDVIRGNGLLGLDVPMAVDEHGQPLGATTVWELQPNAAQPDALLANRVHQPYVAADLEQPDAVLTVRDTPDGPRRTIPREQWRFGRVQGRTTPTSPASALSQPSPAAVEEGQVVPADTHVWLRGGFEPGRLYELTYRSRISPVVGAGLLAYRDFASFLRYDPGSPCAGGLDHALGYGASQSGRVLRHFLYLGLNVDEQGRTVYDGLLPHIAGARRGEFNHRGGQPSVQSTNSPSVLPPFDYDGLLRRQRQASGVPKIIATNTSAEHWRGDASLSHTSSDAREDTTLPDHVRSYLFAGTQHGSGAPPLTWVSPLDGAHGANPFNTVDYGPLLRAARMNLLAWVRDGQAPPPTAVPRLRDGTALPREQLVGALKRLPGLVTPDPNKLPRMRRLDYGPRAEEGVMAYPPAAGEPYPALASALDGDGNELAGIRLPDVSVPLATHTGWNPRHPEVGGVGQTLAMMGSTLPFAPTAAARQAADDPRPSIAERYASREDFLARVRSAAEELVRQRYVLPEDVDLVLELNAARYDYFSRRGTPVAPVP
jgi:hypothetical protein